MCYVPSIYPENDVRRLVYEGYRLWKHDVYVHETVYAQWKSCLLLDELITHDPKYGVKRSFQGCVDRVISFNGYRPLPEDQQMQYDRQYEQFEERDTIVLVTDDGTPLGFNFSWIYLTTDDNGNKIHNRASMFGGIIFHREYHEKDKEYPAGLRGNWSTHT